MELDVAFDALTCASVENAKEVADLDGAFHVRYGKKLHVVSSGSHDSHHVLVEVMKAMVVAVEASLDRLHAEFFEDNSRRTLSALDVSLYSRSDLKLINVSPEEGGAKRQALMKNLALWMRLGKDLRLPELEHRDIIIVLTVALSQRDRLSASAAAKSRGIVDNRAVWVCSIIYGSISKNQNIVRAFKCLLPLFAAFFAFEAGTNSSERGLGRHARHRDAHVGPQEIAISWSEVTFEIDEDGPSEENAIAQASPDKEAHGMLQLTDFSRKCARLWVGLHGRRFCSYKVRKDKGVTDKRRKKDGSMTLVRERQRSALRALACDKFESADTLFGEKRARVIDEIREKAKHVVTSKRLNDFKKRTAEIVKQRRDLKSLIQKPLKKSWAQTRKFRVVQQKIAAKGRGKGSATKGRGKVRATIAAKGSGKGRGKAKVDAKSLDVRPTAKIDAEVACSDQPTMLPMLKRKEVQIVSDAFADGRDSTSKYIKLDARELKKAEQVAVAKVTDLDTARGDDLHALCRAWTVIIKEGKRVREMGCNDRVVQFAPSGSQSCRLDFSKNFIAKHLKKPLAYASALQEDGSNTLKGLLPNRGVIRTKRAQCIKSAICTSTEVF